jgi:hypothetical protein
MVENTQFAAEGAGMPAGALSSAYIATELERLHLMARIAAVTKQMRKERQARSTRYWISFWPLALGVLLGFYAPLLRDLAAGYAPWAATLLFPLSVVVQQRELHFSLGMAQALSQVMLYAQLPLDGLLARMVLKHRPTVWSVCGQVTCLHVLALLYLGLVSGSLSQILGN